MAIVSDNKQGNPYHDEGTGKFTSKNGSGHKKSHHHHHYKVGDYVLSLIPKTNSDGTPRRFFYDLSYEEQKDIKDNFYKNHGKELKDISLLAQLYNTSYDNSEERERKRFKWLSDEINSQTQTPKKKERKATIVLGLPGSGKSTISSPIVNENGAFLVDADNFKERIDEFREDPRMVSAVHQESVWLADDMRSELAKQGYNMVIGKVGTFYEGGIEDVIKDLKRYGYEIEVDCLDVPFEQSMERTIGRYERGETNRLLPLSAITNSDKNLLITFEKALMSGLVSGGSLYSNDVPIGTAPKLLKKFIK